MFSLEGFSQLSCTLVCTLICGKYYMCWLLWRWRRRNHLRYYTCSMGERKMNVFVPKDSAGELHTKAACIPVVEMMEMEPSELPHAKINPSSWGAKHTEFTGNRQKKLYNFTCLWLKRVCIYVNDMQILNKENCTISDACGWKEYACVNDMEILNKF